MESITDLYKAECIDIDIFHAELYKSVGEVEYAQPDGSTSTTTGSSTAPSAPPTEFEQARYAAVKPQVQPT